MTINIFLAYYFERSANVRGVGRGVALFYLVPVLFVLMMCVFWGISFLFGVSDNQFFLYMSCGISMIISFLFVYYISEIPKREETKMLDHLLDEQIEKSEHQVFPREIGKEKTKPPF